MPFLAKDGSSVRTVLGRVTSALENPITVDTQTTDGGFSSQGQLFGQPQPELEVGNQSAGGDATEASQPATMPWVPPLHAEQWSGSIPDESDMGAEPADSSRTVGAD